MFYLQQLLFDYPILSVLQLGFTVWMLIDAQRHGQEHRWLWIILILQPIGPWIYFFLEKRRRLDWPGFAGLFERKASVEQLQFRAHQSPTIANQLDLAE